MPQLRRPLASEHAAVLSAEIALVPNVADFAAMLRENAEVTRALAHDFGEARAAHRYAEGKWSVRETIGHLSDCERVLSYRLLRALRADATLLPGFDHNAYVPAGRFEGRTLADVVREFSAVRSVQRRAQRDGGARRQRARRRVRVSTKRGDRTHHRRRARVSHRGA